MNLSGFSLKGHPQKEIGKRGGGRWGSGESLGPAGNYTVVEGRDRGLSGPEFTVLLGRGNLNMQTGQIEGDLAVRQGPEWEEKERDV